MMTDLANKSDTSILEKVILQGDLAELSPDDRVAYYARVCESLGVNPLTRPFEYIKLNGKLTLYARKDCTDQLRKIHNVSAHILAREMVDGIYVVTARAEMPSGRTDESIGAVDISKLSGESKANALMKSESKAKRRVTLSICGLGYLDETEVSDIPAKDVEPVTVDVQTGQIIEKPKTERLTAKEQATFSSPLAKAIVKMDGTPMLTDTQAKALGELYGDGLKALVKKHRDEDHWQANRVSELTEAQAAQLLKELQPA